MRTERDSPFSKSKDLDTLFGRNVISEEGRVSFQTSATFVLEFRKPIDVR
jgi:hypothetical protein